MVRGLSVLELAYVHRYGSIFLVYMSSYYKGVPTFVYFVCQSFVCSKCCFLDSPSNYDAGLSGVLSLDFRGYSLNFSVDSCESRNRELLYDVLAFPVFAVSSAELNSDFEFHSLRVDLANEERNYERVEFCPTNQDNISIH